MNCFWAAKRLLSSFPNEVRRARNLQLVSLCSPLDNVMRVSLCRQFCGVLQKSPDGLRSKVELGCMVDWDMDALSTPPLTAQCSSNSVWFHSHLGGRRE